MQARDISYTLILHSFRTSTSRSPRLESSRRDRVRVVGATEGRAGVRFVCSDDRVDRSVGTSDEDEGSREDHEQTPVHSERVALEPCLLVLNVVVEVHERLRLETEECTEQCSDESAV